MKCAVVEDNPIIYLLHHVLVSHALLRISIGSLLHRIWELSATFFIGTEHTTLKQEEVQETALEKILLTVSWSQNLC